MIDEKSIEKLIKKYRGCIVGVKALIKTAQDEEGKILYQNDINIYQAFISDLTNLLKQNQEKPTV